MSNDCLDNSDKKPNAGQHTAFEILVPGHMQILACVDSVSGRAKPGAIVKVRVDNFPLQKTKVNSNGRWSISLECPLPPGHHVVFAASSQAGEPTEKACFIVGRHLHIPPCGCDCQSHCSCHGRKKRPGRPFIPANMPAAQTTNAEDFQDNIEDNEENHFEAQNAGPELPPSPELLPAPEIFYPSHEQEIHESLPIVKGKAEPENMVIVCIRGMMCSRTKADEKGDFSVTFPRELTQGSYTVTALQADSKGNRSELVDHSFTVSF